MDRMEIFAGLVEAFPQPTVVVGAAQRILAMNLPARTLFRMDARGRHKTAILRQPDLLAAVETCLEDGAEGVVRYHGFAADGEHIYEARVRPVPGNLGALIAFDDLSQKEQQSQQRRDFVANVSHELRTPLTALTGFIETLQGAAAEDAGARTRFLGLMAHEAERMNRLVQDLLNLSRVESAERVRPTEVYDLCDLLLETVARLRKTAERRETAIEAAIPPGPIPVHADPDQLQQVFANLLENAIKYGGGHVRLEVSRIARDPALRAPAVAVDIHDDGAGIDPIHVPRLTERFYRVDSHRSRAQGGTGLGLAIVKHIVGRHGGKLRISSVPGEGSTFSVVLACDAPPIATEGASLSPASPAVS
ncbi:MAG: sensor histidine kinase [Shimia sp.]